MLLSRHGVFHICEKHPHTRKGTRGLTIKARRLSRVLTLVGLHKKLTARTEACVFAYCGGKKEGRPKGEGVRCSQHLVSSHLLQNNESSCIMIACCPESLRKTGRIKEEEALAKPRKNALSRSACRCCRCGGCWLSRIWFCILTSVAKNPSPHWNKP